MCWEIASTMSQKSIRISADGFFIDRIRSEGIVPTAV